MSAPAERIAAEQELPGLIPVGPASPPDLSVLSRLLDEAMDLGPAQVAAWLAALPEEHAHLLPRLRHMLAEHMSNGQAGFLSVGPKLDDNELLADESTARAGEVVGPYRLLREVGRGGMGAVWLAERADGSVRRKVALKLPHATWATGLGERFAREREILADLEHANIARLYDVGVDQHGRPFMALEFVEGLPIDEFCDRHGLATQARLRLLLQVADAVAYAHGRLVLHRDLKPGNILVTRDGQVRLLDFGIAKLMEGGKADATALTQHGGRALTLDYASPEQIRGEAVGTASDVYSLGVVAFELLAGERPYRLKRGTAAELEVAIMEQDLPLGSAVAKAPATRQALRGDLDAILNKALKKTVAERYGSVDALALDWRHYLEGQRVDARPDTLVYTATRLARRHRMPIMYGALAAVAFGLSLGFGATALVILALLVGLGVAFWQARRADEQAMHAKDAAERARAVKEFVVEVFRFNERGHANDVELRQMPVEMLLERGAKLVESKFPGQPELQAELYGVVGGIFADMGADRLAIDYLSHEVETLEAIHAGKADQARANMRLVEPLLTQERFNDAYPRALRAAELVAADPVLSAKARVLLAQVFESQGKYGETLLELERVERALGGSAGPSATGARCKFVRAELLAHTNRFDQSWPVYLSAIGEALAAEGSLSPLAVEIRLNATQRLVRVNRPEEARTQLEAALATLRAIGGSSAIRAAKEESSSYLSMMTMMQVTFAEVTTVIERNRAWLAGQGARVPDVIKATVDFYLGWAHLLWGDVMADSLISNSAATLRREWGQAPRLLSNLAEMQGCVEMKAGRHEQADAHLRERRDLQAKIEAHQPHNAYDWARLALNLGMQGRFDEAEAELVAAPSVGSLDGEVGPQTEFSSIMQRALARIRLDRGDAPGAMALLPPAGEEIDDWIPIDGLTLRGETLAALGRNIEALSALERVLQRDAADGDQDEPIFARLRAVMGICAFSAGQRERASELAARARSAFIAQPDVSPYYKVPLERLHALLAAPTQQT